jgi:5-methylcytosine-specific restriction endonuclease McrA
LLSEGIAAAAERLAPIAEPRREVTLRKEPSETVIASIYKRDRFRCRYCGCRVIPTQVMRLISHFFPEDFPYHPNWKGGETHPAIAARSATLDHLVPWTTGGTNNPENLVCACWICNQMKGDLLLEQLGWELLPASDDADWDGLTRYYRRLWEHAGCPSTADHPVWVRLFD